MNTVLAIAGIVIKELYRRKDFYVLFVLTAVITLLMGSVSYFKEDAVVRSLKEIVLLLIWISALVIAIATTARQIPAERENRTIFPLLAKPVSRAQVLLGKFTGCWLACGMALLMFYLFFGVLSASREHHWPLRIFFQGFWLQWVMLAIVIALVVLGSLVFTAPSSNATICFILVIGALLLGGHLDDIARQRAEPLGTIVYAFYFLIPHLEWYDIRHKIIYDHNELGWWPCAGATVYAAVYAALLLFAAWLLFRRKALNK
jgi:ABC-type transport system involved in multi-copper enzyme maturation permease subunit